MKNNVSQNPSSAGDDDNLWPDWNSAAGVGKDSRGDAEEWSFSDIFSKAREGAGKRAEKRAETKDERGKAKFAHDADSYQDA